MVLLGNRKENYLGQLIGRDTNPIPKLLPFIFLSEVASQTRGGLDYLDPGVRMENSICFIFSYISRARKRKLNLCCLKIMEFRLDSQF